MSKAAKVLIVDDDARNLRILEEILSDDFVLEKAGNGEEALAKVQSFMPDIVLLDIMMPDIDGLEVCRRIRRDDHLRFIKIILVSGKARLEERLEGYAAGADDYITKPFDHLELMAKVNVFTKLKAVEEVDQLKTDFLSLITHETGTPLNAVIGFSSLLLSKGSLSDEDHEMVQEILYAGERLHEKISRILLLNSLRKSGDYDKHAIAATDLIEAVTQEMAPQSEAKNISVRMEGFQNSELYGNFDLLKKAFGFLLENAIKYSPEGGSVLFRQSISDDNRHCSIELKDSGPGISDELAETLFEAFQFSDVVHHSAGLGISLALTKLTLELHGGSISAENNRDGGACFTASLPVYVNR